MEDSEAPRGPARDATDSVALTRLSARYTEVFPFRAAIQAIPVLGGSLDSMLAGLGARWQYERLQDFISMLDRRLRVVEGHGSLPDVQPSEPLYDFIMRVFDHVIRTRSERKREAFAAIAARQTAQPRPWDEADAAARLLADLSDLHFEILRATVTAPVCGAPLDGLRVISLSATSVGGAATPIAKLLPGIQERPLKLACSELVGRGLLHDEGSAGGMLAQSRTSSLPTWLYGFLSGFASVKA